MAILCEINNAAAKNGFFNQQRWEMTEATIRERWCVGRFHGLVGSSRDTAIENGPK